SYSTVLTQSGGGFSQYQDLAINRWREDVTKDNWGMFFYVNNLNSNNFWSSAYQPCLNSGDNYEVAFEPDKATYTRRDGNIETKTEIVVSPEDSVEIRRLSISNHSQHNRVMEVTSYFEPILAGMEDDAAHPAFVNLFVETEYIPDNDILLMTRRPRSKDQGQVWLANTMVLEGDPIGPIQYETDRSKFVGRGRDLSSPKALDPDQPLSNTTGAVLDSIMSLRNRIGIDSGNTAKLAYIVAVASTREEAINLAKNYHNPGVITRAFELAWTHSQVEMRYLNISASEVNLYQMMLSSIIYSNPYRASLFQSLDNKENRQKLWSYGISGDLPIAIIEVSKIEHLEMVRQMLSIHEYWRLKGILVDLIILNQYGNSYEQPLQERIGEMLAISHVKDLQDRSGGVFQLSGSVMPEEDKILLAWASRVFISGDLGSIASQIKDRIIDEDYPRAMEYSHKEILPHNKDDLSLVDPQELLYFNDFGGFTEDGKEYLIRLKGNTMTPLPWSNVVANDEFGFLVTESGSGYTWYSNSRENKITPWSNDPILDPPGEIVYIRDEDTGDTWTITPGPIRNEGEYVIRHGQGYSVFEHYKGRLNQELTLFVCPDQPVKFYHIKLKNDSQIPRRLSLTFYVEWVCGVNRIPSNQFIITEKDDRLNAVFARNPYNEEHGDRIAFIATNKSDSQVTGDRVEFIGRNGNLKNPVALDREGLSGKVGGGLDPCGAIRIVAEIPPGEEDEIVFILGQGQDIDQARDLIRKYAHGNIASDILDLAKNFWDEKLGRVQVTTPDESMNIMLNRWLLYQTFCCRIMARTGFYQAGGAYGFRDQLQDSLALIYSDPNRMREQIILSSEHQFTEGDVQHWWHPPHRGVRTRITDDLLFLPYLTANYIEGVRDWSILDVHTHYLEDDPLAEDEHDRYNMPNLSENKESIYDHCIRAIEKSLRFGERGLPLMGMGDWNDGMDNVGAEGRGESVWLGWFLYTVLDNFIPICKERGDIERAEKYSKILDELQQNIERNGWDGGWYRRAYFDDGTPLGSEKNEECRIDAISQSWAVISGAAAPSRARIALDSMERHLIHKEEGLIQLLTPPFHKSSLEPGYIKGYVPGVRENGGQYTHAATWAILANAKLGHGNKAWEFFHMINPVNHGSTWFEINKYKAEPYVMAADVYTVQPHVGRGGWTWYTGSSAWMYRVGIEWILGLKLRGDEIYVDPCIPSDWEGFDMTYKHKNTSYDIRVENPEGISQGVKEVWLDNKRIDDKSILLQDEGETHQVKVILGTT
ncbi:MAG TPA: glycosyl transferase family 36, partial [Clostridia bacterium]|nr:glycosyl transferase family 36 [Clostridia bacterium]